MALPFLKLHREAGITTKVRQPDENTEQSPDSDSMPDGMVACAHDIISAIESKDPQALAAALHAAFEIADSAPHAEGPHEEEAE